MQTRPIKASSLGVTSPEQFHTVVTLTASFCFEHFFKLWPSLKSELEKYNFKNIQKN